MQKTFNAKTQRRKGTRLLQGFLVSREHHLLVSASGQSLWFRSCQINFASLRLCAFALNSDGMDPAKNS